MAATPEFNPDLQVEVRKEFNGGRTREVGKGRRKTVEPDPFRPGEIFPWKEMGVRADRVAALMRTGFVTHTSKPYRLSIETQKRRLKSRGVEEKPTKRRVGKPPPELQAPAPKPKLERKYTPRNKVEDSDDGED